MPVRHTNSPLTPRDEQTLMSELWDPEIRDNPLNFVKIAFPWGKSGTPLEKWPGPKAWQMEELGQIADHIKSNQERIAQGKDPLVYQSATVSGRGVGKSALVAWLTLWMESCVIGSSTIVTANTEPQLKSKTWPEVGKWHTLLINRHWFDRSAMSIKPAQWFARALSQQLSVDDQYYFAQALLWNEENPDAFAGHHNLYGTMLIFDEASGIPQCIDDVSEGYFTDPVLHRYWFKFSNGRRNTGPFFEAFHRDRKWWHRRNLDSRNVEGTDKTKLNAIVEKYGEDHDTTRVEVRGMFPKQGDRQFISREDVDAAILRKLEPDRHAALVMGVDVARYGDDRSIIAFRQGRDARSIRMVELKGKDNMEVAAEVAYWIDKTNPNAVCIDAGNGTGVIDRLRQLGYQVHEVWFGSKSPDKEWADKRTYIWAKMRDWIKGGMLPDDDELKTDLTAPEYEFRGAEDVLKLESKEKLKKRGFASPDKADALACTFAVTVARSDLNVAKRRIGKPVVPVAADVDYDIFG